jgi:hypothetical protein
LHRRSSEYRIVRSTSMRGAPVCRHDRIRSSNNFQNVS